MKVLALVAALILPLFASAQQMTEADFVGGYLIAQQLHSDNVIEIRLRKYIGVEGLVITSLKMGSLEKPPQETCTGNAVLIKNRVTFSFTCGKDRYSNSSILPAGDLDLRKGVPFSFGNNDYLVVKQKSRYFAK